MTSRPSKQERPAIFSAFRLSPLIDWHEKNKLFYNSLNLQTVRSHKNTYDLLWRNTHDRKLLAILVTCQSRVSISIFHSIFQFI